MEGGDASEAGGGRPARSKCAECDGEAKYRCPACDTPSCSLACVKQHKAAKPCTGKRDLTAFRAIGKMDDTMLTSDYHFLQGALRTVEGARRDPVAPAPAGAGWSAWPARKRLRDFAQTHGTSWLKVAPALHEDTVPSPIPAYLEAWATLLHPGAQPSQVGIAGQVADQPA